MKHFNEGEVTYLENEDITPTGNLAFVAGKPTVVMVQGGFCGYCTQAKPAFSQFAKTHPDVFACTIQIDGNESEKQLAKRLTTMLPNYRGVPVYIGFDETGRLVGEHGGGRDVASLDKFAKRIKK